jgi:hypothetical protein
MSRVATVAIVLAVVAACSLIVLYVLRGHAQKGTVVYRGRTYDCRQVLQSFESTAGPGVYPQAVVDGCVSSQLNGQ